MGCFPFTPTVGALSELHEVCDKRISELLGMIRCNKINNKKIYVPLILKVLSA